MQQQELEEALSVVLSRNFDAMTKSCFLTCIKLLDNFIQTPTNPLFWCINLSNPAIQNKILNAKGGLQVLLCCGFIQETSLGSNRLVLPLLAVNDNDDEEARRNNILQRCITARRLLSTRCVQDLRLRSEELPKYRPPPPQVPLASLPTSEQTLSTTTVTPQPGFFNPYLPQRFDALSAAVGHNLGPDDNYQSKTEAEVQRLERQRHQLQAQTKQKGPIHRHWQATRPGQTTTIPITDQNTTTSTGTFGGTGGVGGLSDMSLLAAKAMMQSHNNKEQQQQGFTTSAMRKLQKLQHAKVYDYTVLKFTFPNGETLQGYFYPDETIESVQQVVATECLVDATARFQLGNVAPPRSVLSDTTITLEEAQLVPAAKVTIRWKHNQHTSDIRPELFLHSTTNTGTTGTTAAATMAFPTGNSVVASLQSGTAATATTATTTMTTTNSTEQTAADREEALMRRMMGGKKPLGSGNGSGGSKPSTATPKWFQKK